MRYGGQREQGTTRSRAEGQRAERDRPSLGEMRVNGENGRNLRPCAGASWTRRVRNLGWTRPWSQLGSTWGRYGSVQVSTPARSGEVRGRDPGWFTGATLGLRRGRGTERG